jgi:hypothetical protein
MPCHYAISMLMMISPLFFIVIIAIFAYCCRHDIMLILPLFFAIIYAAYYAMPLLPRC